MVLPNTPYIPSAISWERTPIDSAIAHTLLTALHEIVTSPISPKIPTNVSISIVSRKSFSRAIYRTNSTFDPSRFAAHFLDETDFTPLIAVSAFPDRISFLRGLGRPGIRVGLMLQTTIEKEQQVAHNLLLEEGLCDRPFLPGAHISIGTLAEAPNRRQEKAIGDYLMSFLPEEIWFNPVTQQTYSHDGLRAARKPLLPEPPSCAVDIH